MSYQGIVPRIWAHIVDSVLLIVVVLLVGSANAVMFLLAGGLISLLYFVILEGLTGATVGKKLLKLRVVRESGEACGLRPALIRNILRIVDSLPFFYVLGLILIARSSKNQRIGDKLAKTVVVRA